MHKVLEFSILAAALVTSGQCRESNISPSTPLPVESWVNYTVLFIYAHIDDMEAASGGLAKLLPTLKSTAHILVMTNGDKGCSNPDVCGSATNEELAEIRKQEQYESGKILGIPQEHMYFLGYEDLGLKMYPRIEVSKRIVNLIRSIQPNVIMTWDSTPYFSMTPSEGYGDLGYHPDHQYSGELTVDAIWLASNSRTWPELGTSWRTPQVYFWAYNPDIIPSHCLDITGGLHEAKTEAFLQMKSQYTNSSEIEDMFMQLGVLVSQTCQWSPGVLAEGYQFILW